MVSLLLQRKLGLFLKLLWLASILPNSKLTFIDFEDKYPFKIRRSGRNNSEGVALSMAQWYLKWSVILKVSVQIPIYITRGVYGV
jgi:hypothetical protein